MTDPIISQDKINELQQLLDNNNRTQAYLDIFEITGSTSVLREAYISSFSEGYGAIANTANDIAQWAHSDAYTLAVDDFSRAIAARLVSDMQDKFDAMGNGYLTDLEINASAQAEWDSRNLGEAFPGSPILAAQHLGNLQLGQFVDSVISLGSIYSFSSAVWNYSVSALYRGITLVPSDASPITPQDFKLSINMGDRYQIQEAESSGIEVFYVVDTQANNRVVHVFDTGYGNAFSALGIHIGDFGVEEFIMAKTWMDISSPSVPVGTYTVLPYNINGNGTWSIVQKLQDPVTGRIYLKEIPVEIENGQPVLTEEILNNLAISIKIESSQEFKIESVREFRALIPTSAGSYEVVTLNPAEVKIASFDLRLADAEANGLLISHTTSTVTLYGVTFTKDDTVLERSDGTRMHTSEFKLPNGGIIPGNGVVAQKFVQEFDTNGALLNSRENTSFVDQGGRIHETLEQRQGVDGNWHVQETIIGHDGSRHAGDVFVVPNAQLLDTLQFIGGTAGSLLGSHLADGNVYKSIIYSAFIGAAGKHFGTFAAYLATVGNDLDNALQAMLGESAPGTLLQNAEFANTFYELLANKTTSALAGVIVDEVGDVLGLDGVVGEVFDVVGNTVTAGVIGDTFDFVFRGMEGGVYTQLLNHGFDFSKPALDAVGQVIRDADGNALTLGDMVQIQILDAVGRFAGARLAGEVIEAESEIAAIFGSVGSTIGGAIGLGVAAGQSLGTAISMAFSTSAATANAALAGAVAGPLGIAIGAFIGTIAGTALGNAFGGEEHPSSFTFVDFNPATKLYQMGGTFTNDGGPAQLSADMADAVLQGVNDIIAATGGTVRHTSVAPELDIGWKEGTFFVNIRDGAYHEFGSAGDAISFAALHTLKNFDLVGGHAVVMRAWHNSEATTIQEWKEDIEVAEAFQLYLTNPTGILAMMMDQPDSAMAQSWAAILKRAAELQLHLPHERDLDGGWNELLLARGDIDPSLIPNIEGDSIVLTDPVTGQQTVLHHVIGPGYEIVRMTGTDGNDVIQVIVNGPSITYVDAGAGDDIVNGSDQRDIILGGSGDDTINGNAGDDWINGGSGEDTIHGNGGLDLIYGGDDNDLLIGDEDGDAIYGGLGDDNMEGRAGNDELFGGAGNDTLNGNEGVDVLKGEQGNDTLYGNSNDKLYGGQGNDTYYLTGSAGSQANIARGEGHDVVYGNTTYVSYIRFDYNISPNELWFQASGNDLMIKVLGEDQSILVKDIFNTANPSKFFIYFGDQLRIATSNGVYDGNTFLWKEAHLNSQHVAAGTWSGPSGQYNYMTEANLLAKYNAYQTWVNQGTQPSWMLDPFNGVQGHGWENVSLGPDPKYFGTTGNDSYGIAPGGDYSGPYVFGNAGNDTVTVPQTFSYQTYDWVYGDSGNDVINGGYGGDLLVGGLGDDTIDGQAGNDRIYGGYGNDTLMGQDSQDTIYGGAGNDNILGQQGWDTLFGGDGDDYIEDYHGGNSIYGEAGNDTITITGVSDNLLDGGDGNDIITAHNGNDRLYGGASNDTLDGAGGNDLVYGDAGDDTLKYTLSSNLTNQDSYDGGAGVDKIVLNLTAAQFAQDSIKRDLLRLRDKINGQQVITNFTFLAFALAVSNVEAMEVKVDGVLNNIAFALTNGTASAETLNGTSAHDKIKGQDGADTINGNAGNDLLEGGIGNDIVNGGDGFDDITGGDGNDTLGGGNGDDDIQGEAGDDIITGDAGNDVLFGGDGIDNVSGGIGDDTVSGGSGDDLLTGSDGNDKLLGESGDDTLSGNAGNDTLEGGSGDDILEGGTGADALIGGIGNDEYRFNVGDGHDTVSDSSGTADVIRLGTGITQTNVSIAALATNDLKITFSGQSNDSITLLKQGTTASSALTVEKLIFSDNSEINLATALTLSMQNDRVSAVEDVPVTISVLSNDNAFNGNALKITSITDAPHGSVVLNANGTITYTSDLDYVGADSFTYTVTDMFGHTATGTVALTVAQAPLFVINGTAAAETINGTVDDDLINPLAGNDTANGLGGNDVFAYTAGFDTYNGGTGLDTADFTGFNWAVWVDLDYGTNHEAHTVDQTTVVGGTWRAIANLNDIENVTGSNHHDRIWGNAGNNVLRGGTGNDSLYGEGGNDTLLGGTGNDILEGGLGDDVYLFNLSDGQDTINETGGTDTIKLGTGFSQSNVIVGNYHDGNPTLTITFTNSPGDRITFNSYGNGRLEKLIFADGTEWTLYNIVIGSPTANTLTGDAGANFVSGLDGADVLYGGDGNDLMYGGSGNDNVYGQNGDDYFFARGGVDFMDGGAGSDTVLLGGNIHGMQFPDHTVNGIVNLATGTIQHDGINSNHTITNIENVRAGTGNDSITGDNNVNRLDGNAGNDAISGGGGNDTLLGGAGNDTLNGNDGNDTIYGQDGLDTLWGNLGADVFAFEATSAYNNVDVVKDFSTVQGDKLNVHDLLAEYDSLTEALTDFVKIEDNGANSILTIDRDGAGSAYGWTQIATLENVTGLTDEVAQVAAGRLVV